MLSPENQVKLGKDLPKVMFTPAGSLQATPFHLRPSAQPFIFRRGLELNMWSARRQTPVGTREVSAPAESDALEDYAHLPSARCLVPQAT